VCAPILLRDIIGVRKDILCVGVVPLQGDLNGNAVLRPLMGKMEYLVNRCLVFIQVFDEGLYTAFVFEVLFFGAALVD
jgi:hypothetical protein